MLAHQDLPYSVVKQDYDANILMAKMVAEDLERDNNTASVLASSLYSSLCFMTHASIT
jgi:hypothetical protein